MGAAVSAEETTEQRAARMLGKVDPARLQAWMDRAGPDPREIVRDLVSAIRHDDYPAMLAAAEAGERYLGVDRLGAPA